MVVVDEGLHDVRLYSWQEVEIGARLSSVSS